jgi:hypothetical protein
MRTALLIAALGTVLNVACSSSSPSDGPHLDAGSVEASSRSDASGSASEAGSDGSTPPADACPTVPLGSPHSIIGNVTLSTDSMGVPFATQNGSVVHIAIADLVGKTLVWATTPGGEQVANVAMPTEAGVTTIGSDLTAHFTSGAKYTNGPWELAVFVSVTGGDITMGPQPGDLAGFDLTPPPACEPPVTGVSIRVTINNADATVTLDNNNFIRF